ncbi:MAG: mandelate racemase/muconate lactonizing enzyme family protein [Trueperaceae bacterium]
MKIVSLEPFILHVPVSRGAIADGTHRISHWGTPGVMIRTDAGITGHGYTGTHAHLATDRMIVECIEHGYGPELLGKNPLETRSLWETLHRLPPLQWIGRAGITHLALAAVDTALWDIKAKAAGVPLWSLLGGSSDCRPAAYDTDGGWLDRAGDVLVADVSERMAEGYRAVKVKVGSSEEGRDLRRLEQVRQAIGPEIKLMVDANGSWDLVTALRVGRRLTDYDVYWLEEPIWYDDLPGHARLARSLDTPIALGEQLYSVDAFRDFITAGAVHFVQADAVRLAGVTEWWRVAELARAFRLPVVPHIGDMMQVHLHLAIAHPACDLLEYIPWMRECFIEPATVREGRFVIPEEPGAGTTLTVESFERYGVR